jgi:hypothetical protein
VLVAGFWTMVPDRSQDIPIPPSSWARTASPPPRGPVRRSPPRIRHRLERHRERVPAGDLAELVATPGGDHEESRPSWWRPSPDEAPPARAGRRAGGAHRAGEHHEEQGRVSGSSISPDLVATSTGGTTRSTRSGGSQPDSRRRSEPLKVRCRQWENGKRNAFSQPLSETKSPRKHECLRGLRWS